MDKSYASRVEGNKRDGLNQHMTEGFRNSKYRSVDYDRLQAELSEKKFGSIKTSMKLAKIEKRSQQHKESSIIKHHQLLWQKEFLRLQLLRKKTEADVDTLMRGNHDSDSCEKIYKDFHYYEARLSSDFDGFRKATVSPVWNLRDDLRYWLMESHEELKLGSPDMLKKHAEISSVIAGVKSQQQEVMERLLQEQQRLDAELQTGVLTELFPSPLLKHTTVSRGIPKEAINLPCSDAKLKSDVLGEFIFVDEKYESVIANLRQRYALAISSDEFGGWDPDDHFKFVSVYEQYPAEIPNRRKLLFDRLKRHLPNKCRTKLSEHEDWWMDFKCYHERLKVIYADWARHKLELTHKAQFVFSEADVACELDEVRSEYYQRQKQLCQVLYERVKEWREKKMEALQLEVQINEEAMRQMEIIAAQGREAENRRRSKEKENICHYHEAREEERRKVEQTAELRLKELKKQMEEQAIYDRERMHFREEQLSKKIEEQRKKEAEKLKENEEMEARLEALRAQVRIIADSDPQRALQGTKAWEARQKEEESGEIPMLMPLFKVNGYTSNQITSDHRVRLEQKLREAGLHTTDYARQMIQAAAPPKPPRRDLQHTFKFKDP